MCQSSPCNEPFSDLSTESARLLGQEGGLVLLGLSTVVAVRQGELQVLVSVHDVLVSLQILISDNGGADDLDGTVASAVGSSHLLVALLDGAEERSVTVLLVHVVSAGARVVSQPDSVVLDLHSALVNLPTSPKMPQNAIPR